MAVTETTTESWGSRLGGSIKGVAIGGALFIAGIPLLFWNEGRAVKTAKALEEGASVCVQLPNADTIDATMDGKLVHVTGTAVTDDVLTDDLFPALAPKAMRLTRKVEFYQWVENERKEKKKNVGGSETTVTTYTYARKWVSKPVDSSSFREAGHDNQVFMPEATARTLVAENARYGAFELTKNQINRIVGDKAVELKPEYIPDGLKGRVTISGNYAYVGFPVGGMMQPGMMNRMTPAPGMQPGVVPPGMIQTVATQPVPVENIGAVPQTTMGGFVTVPSIQPNRMSVTNVDGVPFVITPDGTPTPVMPNGIYYAGNLHAITATVPGNGFVWPAPPVVQYADIPGYGSLPLFTIENKSYVRLATGALAPYIRQTATAGQIIVNGTPIAVTVSTTATSPAPAYNTAPAVQPAVAQPGMVQPGMVQPATTVASGTMQGTANPANPQVGDVRISWTMVPAEMPVSIVAVQTGTTFAPYVAKDSAAGGYTVDLLETGTKTKEEMFQNAENANTMMTWILRVVGWLMMYMGLKMILKPLEVLGDVLPILGDLIGIGTGVIAFLIATPVALITIAIAWLFYRPLLGIVLLAAAGGLIYLLIKKRAAAKAAKAEAEKEAPAAPVPAEEPAPAEESATAEEAPKSAE
ncbi:MAG: hypothetical protein IKA23_02435 [Akkermansia sp.]|nr:hypothetical protein [Akkermansia sp.]